MLLLYFARREKYRHINRGNLVNCPTRKSGVQIVKRPTVALDHDLAGMLGAVCQKRRGGGFDQRCDLCGPIVGKIPSNDLRQRPNAKAGECGLGFR